jgi:molybdate/tungstate transport system substrate-binding protein
MLSRRGFTLSTVVALLAMTADAVSAAESVNVSYADSWITVMERTIVPLAATHGLSVGGESKGSLALANLIRAGLRSPDVFISADPAVTASLMGSANGDLVDWYATFATTRLVIGYAPISPFAHDFVDVSRSKRSLVDVLLQPGLRLGRTDPALDPKGYRVIIAMNLLERFARRPGFAHQLLGENRNPAQVLPEDATLLGRLEGGELDAAFLYATESTSRSVPAVELPRAVNLGDPNEAQTYASVSVNIDGKTRVGAPIAYTLTIPRAAHNPHGAAEFVALLLASEARAALTKNGFRMLARVQVAGNRNAIPARLQTILS